MEDGVSTSIIFPKDMYEEIKRMAANDDRSINSMVKILVNAGLQRGLWPEALRKLDNIERSLKDK